MLDEHSKGRSVNFLNSLLNAESFVSTPLRSNGLPYVLRARPCQGPAAGSHPASRFVTVSYRSLGITPVIPDFAHPQLSYPISA